LLAICQVTFLVPDDHACMATRRDNIDVVMHVYASRHTLTLMVSEVNGKRVILQAN